MYSIKILLATIFLFITIIPLQAAFLPPVEKPKTTKITKRQEHQSLRLEKKQAKVIARKQNRKYNNRHKNKKGP